MNTSNFPRGDHREQSGMRASGTWDPPEIERVSSGSGSWHNTTQDNGSGKRSPDKVVFFLDVDNTLLDNDHIEADLKDHLTHEFGAANRDRYWAHLEELRVELGYADYLGALQRYRLGDLNDPRLLLMSSYLVDYPFEKRLYPGALDAIKHLRRWGLTVLLSDGDVVFQPRKIQRSGLWETVDTRVLIYIHKEQMLELVTQRYPARHYVMVDDKLGILAAMKEILGERLTTVFAHQGHYARDSKTTATNASADFTIEHIRDLVDYDLATLLGTAATGRDEPEEL